MLIFLTGPTGSGKTDTSWALLALIPDLVFLDCDWFASRSGFNWRDPADVDSVYRAIQSQIAFHLRDGRSRFVVTLTLELAVVFEQRRPEFIALMPITRCFRLICARGELRRRIVSRDRDQWAIEVQDALMQTVGYDRAFPDDRLFDRIDTTEPAANAVAAAIADQAGLRLSGDS